MEISGESKCYSNLGISYLKLKEYSTSIKNIKLSNKLFKKMSLNLKDKEVYYYFEINQVNYSILERIYFSQYLNSNNSSYLIKSLLITEKKRSKGLKLLLNEKFQINNDKFNLNEIKNISKLYENTFIIYQSTI